MSALNESFAWVAFLGAWLLVAGPIYQASVELRTEPDMRGDLAETTRSVTTRRHISLWWWLLPPVAVLLHWRATRRFKRAALGLLTPAQITSWITVANKAIGWWLVAAGAFLLACHESEQLIADTASPTWTLLPAIALPTTAAIAFTVLRQLQTVHLSLPADQKRRPAG